MSADVSERRVVLMGTDLENPRGGIGVAMAGFERVLRDEGLLHAFIPTYRPDVRLRAVRMAAAAVRPMLRAIREIRSQDGVPVVYDHAGGPVSIARETSMLRIARRAGAKTLLQLHSVHVARLLEHPVGRPALKRLVRVADGICALTPYWSRMLEEHGIGPVSVVPNPLPPWAEDEAARPLPDRSDGPLRFLTMTRLVHGKGVDLAIEAMRHAPSGARLTVAGEGPERRRLEALAAGLPVDFVGWVRGEAKRRLLAESHAFVLPTRYDATGMGFVEAAAYGLPVVALRWRAIPDIVEDGRTGLLVDDPDGRSVAAALRSLEDASLRRQLGTQAKARALERFGAAAVGERIRAALPRG